MQNEWTKEESDKALKHIEMANYELGSLIEKVGDLHGDIKVVKSTIENEIRPEIKKLKDGSEESKEIVLKLEKNTAKWRAAYNTWEKVKWLAIGAAIIFVFNIALKFVKL